MITLLSCGSKFKVHHAMKNHGDVRAVKSLKIDMEEEWPFTEAIQNGDPLLSELILEAENNGQTSQLKGKVMINSDPLPCLLSRVISSSSPFTMEISNPENHL